MLLVIPYMFLMVGTYSFVRRWTNDKILSPFIFHISINLTYIFLYFFAKPSIKLVENMGSLLLAHYIHDINLLFHSDENNRETLILHHICSIALIYIHASGVLPLKLGIDFLALFEMSNTFYYGFQLANKKNWIKMKLFFAFPFVVTYVPLRTIAIPVYYALMYPQHIRKIDNIFYRRGCFIMFGFLNIFSIYYGLFVLYKYLLWKMKRT